MSGTLAHLVSNWSAAYSSSALLRTLVAFVHIGGLVSGGGAAIVADRATLIASRRGGPLMREQLHALHATHRVVIAGLAAVILSGVLLFAADLETYATSRIFWLKMVLIAVLMINGAVLARAGRDPRMSDQRVRGRLRSTAVISLTLWLVVTLMGAALPNI